MAQNTHNQAMPFLKRYTWPISGMWRYTPTSIELQQSVTLGPSFVNQYIDKVINSSETNVLDSLFRGGAPVLSFSDHVFSQFPKEQTKLVNVTLGLMRDVLCVRTFSGVGSGMGMILGFYNKPVSPTALEQKRWSLISSHWGAGLRLRAMTKTLTLDTEQIEAVFDSSGKLHDARQGAKESSNRETLREAVRLIDSVRTSAGRSDPDAAMEAWKGLVQGRWSLGDCPRIE